MSRSRSSRYLIDPSSPQSAHVCYVVPEYPCKLFNLTFLLMRLLHHETLTIRCRFFELHKSSALLRRFILAVSTSHRDHLPR